VIPDEPRRRKLILTNLKAVICARHTSSAADAFTTYLCRAALTSRKGYKSGVERFVEYAELYTLLGCLSFALVGEPTIIPATQTRGALASISVDVTEA
jgi:hypothetical protein